MTGAEHSKSYSHGLLWAFVSYAMWGFFPIYWKLLSHRLPLEILAHRMLWSAVFYVLMFLMFSPVKLRQLLRQSGKDWLLSGLASAFLTVNWGIYIYAVNAGHILEGSLAYFINPIMNVAVGVLFFKEKFPLALKLSVAFAVLGVLAKIVYASQNLWISLVLAFTFCSYGITKKLLKIPAMNSSVLEGLFGLIPALIGLAYFQRADIPPVTTGTWGLFVMGGAVTGLPLFLFSFAAQRIPYSVMGMLQFIAPTLQFLVGVIVYKENFAAPEMLSFGLIWTGIVFYLLNSVRVFLRYRPPMAGAR